tara:strand:+ start:747 stop:1184 length:438 start_codon:yes stop_codon:yes gene_type:complete
MKSKSLIPEIPKEEETERWVIIEDTDVIARKKLTLKQIKKLCKERDIDLLGPKGGQLSKKVLLERLEEDIKRVHDEEVAEARKKSAIVKDYQKVKIRVLETQLKKLRKETQHEYDILSKQQTKCAQMDARANEIRITIKAMKELL